MHCCAGGRLQWWREAWALHFDLLSKLLIQDNRRQNEPWRYEGLGRVCAPPHRPVTVASAGCDSPITPDNLIQRLVLLQYCG